MLTASCKLTFGASLAFLGHKGTLLQNTQSLRLHPTPFLQDSIAYSGSGSHGSWGTSPPYGLKLEIWRPPLCKTSTHLFKIGWIYFPGLQFWLTSKMWFPWFTTRLALVKTGQWFHNRHTFQQETCKFRKMSDFSQGNRIITIQGNGPC